MEGEMSTGRHEVRGVKITGRSAMNKEGEEMIKEERKRTKSRKMSHMKDRD